jgi:N-methylhydantoinase A
MSSLRVAVDVGGTFTDICILDEAGDALRVAKVPSTADPIEGVLEGVRQAGVPFEDVVLFSHGTTVATNALITRKLPPAAMVTTKGFRDVIEIRRGNRDDLWDAYKDLAPPHIRRRDRLEVGERIDYAGNVVEPLDEDEARHVARVLRKREVAAVAVCLINAHANPEHEQRLAEILAEELPGVWISTSSDVLPELFEHERFSTTVSNAVLSPLVSNYVSRLEAGLREGGYKGDLVLLHSGGGVMTAQTAERYAARLAASGLAAGAIASRHIATMCGFDNAIGFDMGGTSTDISLVYNGEARITKEWFVEFGYPILFPSIEVLTIGAGGGSLAWIDEAGSLHSGPQSAGAIPGPAAYGRGGEEPTTTDANLVLGRLGGELIGGEMTLDRELASEALRAKVAEPLGLEVDDAARAVTRVANANMADALRLISIRRGYDPREFCLVVFGGAGPLHGVELARELSIPTVLVPLDPGITSAFGCLLVDVRHDLTRMYLTDAGSADPEDLERSFQELEAEGREQLDTEGVPAEQQELIRTIDMRYRGQWRSLSVPVGRPLSSLDDAIATFHAEHQREYNFRRDDTPVEIYRIGIGAIGITPKPDLPRHELSDAPVEPVERRTVTFDGVDEPQDTAIYLRPDLHAGARIEGPAIIEQLDSTVVIPPDVTADVDEWLNLRIAVGQ